MLAGVSEMEFVGLKKPAKIALALAGVSETELVRHGKAPKTHQNQGAVPEAPKCPEHIFIYRYCIPCVIPDTEAMIPFS